MPRLKHLSRPAHSSTSVAQFCPENPEAQAQLYGTPTAQALSDELRRRGLEPRVSLCGDGTTVLEAGGRPGTRIELRPGESRVVCADFETGELMREAVLELLTEL